MDMKALNPAVIDEYRRTGGRLSGDLAGLPVLLLTTTGRRTSRSITTLLGYIEDAGRVVVAASAGGAPTHPDWYRNLMAAPSVTIEVGATRRRAEATIASGPERERLFDRLAQALPGMADHAATAGRQIPVVVLTSLDHTADLATAAERFRSLHRRGDPLVLVNAWDVASAQRVAAAGATAVATSSAAMAAALGVPDDRSTPVDLMLDAIARIAAAVDVPVSADLLDGYGLDAAELVDRLLAAGAVGCNLEDSDHHHPGALVDADDAAAHISAVRAAATRAGVNIVINARIDCYLHAGPDATADVVARGLLYLDAGADCVYPVRLSEPRVAREVVERLDAPVNANVAGDITVADLAASGVSRISIGPMAFHAALMKVGQVASELLGPTVGSGT